MLTLAVTLEPCAPSPGDPEPLLRAAKGRTLPFAWDRRGVVTFRKASWRSLDAARRDFENAAKVTQVQAARVGWLVKGCTVTGTDGIPVPWAPAVLEQRSRGTPQRKPFALPPLNLGAFAHVYGLDAHVRTVYRSLRAAATSDFKARPHVLLHGQAGCGKTELLRAFAGFLGTQDTWAIDAGILTKAGLERELLSRSEVGDMPPVFIVEEIEKTAPANLPCLLQVLDTRGRIERLNAKGDQWAECRPLALATCNDMKKLGRMLGGALASRFSVQLECPRPSPDAMRAILLRHCGRRDWVERVLDFVYKELATCPKFAGRWDDPRWGLALVGCGDDLLDDGPGGALADFRQVHGLPAP